MAQTATTADRNDEKKLLIHHPILETIDMTMADMLLHEHETIIHIRRVQTLMGDIQTRLRKRAIDHDKSKLDHPELQVFSTHTIMPEFGSEAYEKAHEELKIALQHHYEHNSHHPEHHEHGIEDMTLLDLVELLCDWRASTERSPHGCIKRSIDVGQERFRIGPQLSKILNNTIKELGWSCGCSEL